MPVPKVGGNWLRSWDLKKSEPRNERRPDREPETEHSEEAYVRF